MNKEQEKLLHKGNGFKDENGTIYVLFAPIDDSETYVYIANFTEKTVIKLLPHNAEIFIKNMEPVDVGFMPVKKKN